MKKSILSLAVLAALVGCGGGGGESPEVRTVEVPVQSNGAARTSSDILDGKHIQTANNTVPASSQTVVPLVGSATTVQPFVQPPGYGNVQTGPVPYQQGASTGPTNPQGQYTAPAGTTPPTTTPTPDYQRDPTTVYYNDMPVMCDSRGVCVRDSKSTTPPPEPAFATYEPNFSKMYCNPDANNGVLHPGCPTANH